MRSRVSRAPASYSRWTGTESTPLVTSGSAPAVDPSPPILKATSRRTDRKPTSPNMVELDRESSHTGRFPVVPIGPFGVGRGPEGAVPWVDGR